MITLDRSPGAPAGEQVLLHILDTGDQGIVLGQQIVPQTGLQGSRKTPVKTGVQQLIELLALFVFSHAGRRDARIKHKAEIVLGVSKMDQFAAHLGGFSANFCQTRNFLLVCLGMVNQQDPIQVCSRIDIPHSKMLQVNLRIGFLLQLHPHQMTLAGGGFDIEQTENRVPLAQSAIEPLILVFPSPHHGHVLEIQKIQVRHQAGVCADHNCCFPGAVCPFQDRHALIKLERLVKHPLPVDQNHLLNAALVIHPLPPLRRGCHS